VTRLTVSTIGIALVLATTLLLVRGTPGGGGSITINPDALVVQEGEGITGTAMCTDNPPLYVRLIVDGVQMDIDAVPDPEDRHLNQFHFASDGLVGRHVMINATDAAGNSAVVLIQVVPRD
jgi:hypothetical protein